VWHDANRLRQPPQFECKLDVMLPPAITLVLLLAQQPVSADSTASRQIAAPCRLVGDKAIQYLRDHDFFATRKMAMGKIVDDLVIEFVNHKQASTPSGTPLSLNRSSIHKYTQPRHLSPLKRYTDFQADGQIKLTEATGGSCNVALSFKISAFEYVWAPVVMDDGYRSQFISNGVLEPLYIDALVDLFKP
jgi:hypothetical protein